MLTQIRPIDTRPSLLEIIADHRAYCSAIFHQLRTIHYYGRSSRDRSTAGLEARVLLFVLWNSLGVRLVLSTYYRAGKKVARRYKHKQVKSSFAVDKPRITTN